MLNASLSVLLHLISTLDRVLLVNAMGHSAVLSDTSSNGQFMPSLSLQ